MTHICPHTLIITKPTNYRVNLELSSKPLEIKVAITHHTTSKSTKMHRYIQILKIVNIRLMGDQENVSHNLNMNRGTLHACVRVHVRVHKQKDTNLYNV